MKPPAAAPAPPAPAKERLLEGAIACLKRSGYAATTARDISAASNANLASIGYHFGSKEALLDEALVVACERWLAPLVKGGRRLDAGSLHEQVVRDLERFVASLDPNRELVRAFFEALARAERSPLVRRCLADSYERLRAAVGERARRVGADVDAAALDARASAIIAIFDGVMVQWLIDPSRRCDARQLVASLGLPA